MFCKKWWKLNIFPYLIDFLPFLLQVLSLYVYAILLKEFRHSMVLGKSNTKVSEKYCRAPVHRMFIMFICIGIRKTGKIYDSLFWFRYKTFIYLFEFKVFRHEERETQFLSILTFPSDPTTCGPRCKLLVWPRRAPKIDLLRPSPNLNSVFFKFQNPQPIASGHDVIHVPSLISYLEFLLWHLWLSHTSRTHVNTCTQCVHLPNPCTKPKGSQPN